jgi:hypothetical protein
MNNELAYLLGAYFANGCFVSTDDKRIKYHCQHEYNHKCLQAIWKSQFGIDVSYIRSKDRDSFNLDFGSKDIREWLRLDGVDKYVNMRSARIPVCIRKSSWDDILSFLVGYADNDGNFSADSFSIASVNLPWLRHLQEVAQAVGICFGLSIQTQRSNGFSDNPIGNMYMYRTFTPTHIIDFINIMSEKAKHQCHLKHSELIKCANPFKIVSIESAGVTDTYDIEVENTHAYYIGGVYSHNTLSQVAGGVSSGNSYQKHPYFIRRIRISADDPLAKAAIDLGWQVNPEVGTEGATYDERMKNAPVWVIDFPMHSTSKRFENDISAELQLSNYFNDLRVYTDHNPSNTITVAPNEWDLVEDTIWRRWDEFIGLTFLAKDGGTYQLMPYEEITEAEYYKLRSQMKSFDVKILTKHERGASESEPDSSDCIAGACPIR